MNTYTKILLFLSLALASCTPEGPPELNCEPLHENLICREDAYQKGQFIGYIKYEYLPGHQLSAKQYYSVNQSHITETYGYNTRNLLVLQRNINQHGNPTEEKHFTHTEFDSLFTIMHYTDGILTGSTRYDYDNVNRLTQRTFTGISTSESTTFLYTDDGKLFRETTVDGSNQLLSYKLYKHYQPNITRVAAFSAGDLWLSLELFVRDPSGRLLEIRKYNADNQLIGQELFTYENGLLMKHGYFSGSTETEFRLFHYP